MARDSTEFAQQSGERAMQAATFGLTWAREFTEENFNQGRHTLDSFLRVSRKLTEELEDQLCAMRAHNTALTEQMFANAMEFGQKLARAKEPQEVAQCQSEFMARQAQTLADQTKVFGQKIQQPLTRERGPSGAAPLQTHTPHDGPMSASGPGRRATSERGRPMAHGHGPEVRAAPKGFTDGAAPRDAEHYERTWSLRVRRAGPLSFGVAGGAQRVDAGTVVGR